MRSYSKQIGGLLIVVVLLFGVMCTPRTDRIKGAIPGPEGRDEWRAMMRGDMYDSQRVSKAKAAITTAVAKQSKLKDGGIGDWEELARGDEGGRIRTIATHPTDPNILYVGGASGGVWKSVNGGASWTPKSDKLASISITEILVHPTMPDTVYVATGEALGSSAAGSPGAGIYRSFNGGNTWDLLPALESEDLNSFAWVSAMAFDRLDPSKFWFTSRGSGSSPDLGNGHLYLCENHGATMSENTIAGFGLGTTGTILVNPNDNNHIMLAHTSGLTISWDKGLSWTLLSAANSSGWINYTKRAEVAMSSSDANVVYALCEGSGIHGVLLKSSDKGMTWTPQAQALSIFSHPGSSVNQGYYDNVIWVNPLDSDEIILGGIDLWKSTNSGQSFVQISDWIQNDAGLSAHADHHVIIEAIDYSAANPKVYFGNDGGIASTSDWSTVTTTTGWDLLNNNSLGITQYYASDIWDGNIIAGSQDNGVLKSLDDGATMEGEQGGDGGYCAISRQKKYLAYASTQYGRFYVSNPGYVTNINLQDFVDLKGLEYDLGVPFLCPIEVYPNDGHQVIIGGQQLWLIESDPVDYDPIDTTDITPASMGGTVTAIEISNMNSMNQRIAIGTSTGEVWITDNSNWNNWSLKFSVGTTVSSISIAPYNLDKIAITKGGYLEDNLYITTNGGNVWTAKSDGIPALHITKVLWHPNYSNFIYAGTDLGLFSSDNGASSWNVTPNIKSTSDGPVFTEVSDLHFSSPIGAGNRFLYATTYGRGIWRTEQRIRSAVYFDEDAVGSNDYGTQASPYLEAASGNDVQAHGQTWYIDEGSYPVDANNKVIIEKRVGSLQITGMGPVIIGDN